MKILILHHLEEHWNNSLRKVGLSFKTLEHLAYDHCKRTNYDRVIITRFDYNGYDKDILQYDKLYPYIADIFPYGYGWDELDVRQNPDIEWSCWGGNYAPIEDWMRQLRGHNVSIGGCFDGACLLDLETCLQHLNIPYRRIGRLIV